jgi:hypothetical protein
MKHLLFGQKSIFLGDDAAEALIAYAAHIAKMGSGDSVDMWGINAEGNLVATSFLLNSGSNLTAETTDLEHEDPDNKEAIAYIRKQLDLLSQEPDIVDEFRAQEETAVN